MEDTIENIGLDELLSSEASEDVLVANKVFDMIGCFGIRGIYGLSPAELNPEWVETDRPRGIFTQRDREYLENSDDFDGQTERDVRYRIRNRISELLYDSNFFQFIPPSEIEKVVESIGEGSPYLAHQLYVFGLLSLHLAVDAEGEFGEEEYEKAVSTSIRDVEETLESGPLSQSSLSRASSERKTHISVSVDVDIERSEFNEDKLLMTILDGSATQSQLHDYLQMGDLTKLLREANKQDIAEITVTDEQGLTATYHISDLAPSEDSSDDTPTIGKLVETMGMDVESIKEKIREE
jgi:hypothetical protein